MPLDQLGQRAVVFSPHPDDESLGCGGTIIRKKRVGAAVKLIYMTDGSAATHGNLISKAELRAIRRTEALNASRILGLSTSETHFLDFQDGKLGDYSASATERVIDVLRQERPQEVFIPYVHEPERLAADHVATTNIVLAALARYRTSLVVWEYPVWFWLHWPWVSIRQGDAPIVTARAVLQNSLRAFFGVRALIDLRCSVDITDVLEIKQTAIAQHRSQVERLIPSPLWPTLQDIAQGELLECLGTDREFFRRRTYDAPDSVELPRKVSRPRADVRPGERQA
jgi:LmbE family N-acetylglucosaminyl deacetylase